MRKDKTTILGRLKLRKAKYKSGKLFENDNYIREFLLTIWNKEATEEDIAYTRKYFSNYSKQYERFNEHLQLSIN